MKTLEKHTLIYDEDCPLCKVYTGAFIKHGWLDKDGRASYQQLSETLMGQIDMDRSQSEVALVDKETNKTVYGIDAMMRIIGYKIPLLQPLFRQSWFYWFMKRFYFFISYNRKVIAAVKPSNEAARKCLPAFSFKYRISYLIFAGFVTALLANFYLPSLKSVLPAYNIGWMLIVVAGQALLQSALVGITAPRKLMDYMGNLMTVCLIGGLLLLPIAIVARLFSFEAPSFFTGYLWLALAFTAYELYRRIQLLQLSPFLMVIWCYSWLVTFMFCQLA